MLADAHRARTAGARGSPATYTRDGSGSSSTSATLVASDRQPLPRRASAPQRTSSSVARTDAPPSPRRGREMLSPKGKAIKDASDRRLERQSPGRVKDVRLALDALKDRSCRNSPGSGKGSGYEHAELVYSNGVHSSGRGRSRERVRERERGGEGGSARVVQRLASL